MTFIRGIPLSADGMFYDSTSLYVTISVLARKAQESAKEPGITSIRPLALVCSITLYYGQNVSLSVQVQTTSTMTQSKGTP